MQTRHMLPPHYLDCWRRRASRRGEGGITKSGTRRMTAGHESQGARKAALLLMRRVISNHDVTRPPCAEAVCLNSKTEA